MLQINCEESELLLFEAGEQLLVLGDKEDVAVELEEEGSIMSFVDKLRILCSRVILTFL